MTTTLAKKCFFDFAHRIKVINSVAKWLVLTPCERCIFTKKKGIGRNQSPVLTNPLNSATKLQIAPTVQN
jgi:uncharacterized protein YcbX